MFTSMMRNTARRMATTARFSTKNSSSYREKSFKENWLMDSGAYPIMAVIIVAVALPIGAGALQLMEPDNRFFSANRKQIFRGDVQYEHPK